MFRKLVCVESSLGLLAPAGPVMSRARGLGFRVWGRDSDLSGPSHPQAQHAPACQVHHPDPANQAFHRLRLCRSLQELPPVLQARISQCALEDQPAFRV
jgi:hypothetical protein